MTRAAAGRRVPVAIRRAATVRIVLPIAVAQNTVGTAPGPSRVRWPTIGRIIIVVVRSVSVVAPLVHVPAHVVAAEVALGVLRLIARFASGPAEVHLVVHLTAVKARRRPSRDNHRFRMGRRCLRSLPDRRPDSWTRSRRCARRIGSGAPPTGSQPAAFSHSASVGRR